MVAQMAEQTAELMVFRDVAVDAWHPLTVADAAALAAIRGMLASLPPETPGDFAAQRASMVGFAARLPYPDNVRLETVALPASLCAELHVPNATAAGTALLFLHGGAFTAGSAQTHRAQAGALALATGRQVLVPSYRLAPEHPHPAALDDAFTALQWLRKNAALTDIALAGDSAGAGLAVALMHTLNARGLAQVSRAALIAPWLDYQCAYPSYTDNAANDMVITRAGLVASAHAYLPDAATRATHVAAQLAAAQAFAPLLIQVGAADTIVDDALQLACRARVANVSVRLEVWEAMPHVWFAFRQSLDAARAAFTSVSTFLTP